MADEGIRVSISPSTIKSDIRRRLTEPSFASDRFTSQLRFTAPGTGMRSQINVDEKLIASQKGLTAELREVRRAIKSTALGSTERAVLKARETELFARQGSNIGAIFASSPLATERAPEATSLVTTSPSRSPSRLGFHARGMGFHAFHLARATYAGDVGRAGYHALRGGTHAYGLGNAIGGIAGGAGAEGAAEAAGSSLLWPILGTAAAVAGVGLGYEAYEHPAAAKALMLSPLIVHQVHRYARA
jgi:hypothetical protein